MLRTLASMQRLFGPYLTVTTRNFKVTGDHANFIHHPNAHEAFSRQILSMRKLEMCSKDKVDALVELLGPTKHLRTGLDLVGRGNLIPHLDDLLACETPTIVAYLNYARQLKKSDINNGATPLIDFIKLLPEQQILLIDQATSLSENTRSCGL